MARAHEMIRIPRLRAFVTALTALVLIGLLVFFQRYRGADRTAMALSILEGAGLCLVVALIRFQRRFSGQAMTRLSLWGIGLRTGVLAGVCTSGVGVFLLAVRWAIDQRSGPMGDPFLPAFARAIVALGIWMAKGIPAFLVAGAIGGALVGLAMAEAIGISSERIPLAAPDPAGNGEGVRPPGIEG